MRNKKLLTILLSMVVFAVSMPTTMAYSEQIIFGSTIYVDDDNVEGPWDGTLEHPYQFIQDGINAASPGDTVYVFRGTYEETITISFTLTLEGEDASETIIDGGNNLNVVYLSGNEVHIFGFTIQNSGNDSWTNAGIKVESDYNVIEDNIMKNNCNGIFLVDADYNTVVGNKISFNEYNGIGVLWDSDSNEVTGNRIDNCSRYGISIGYSINNSIVENEIFDIESYGITVDSGSNDTTVSENYITNSSIGIFIRGSFNCVASENEVSGSTGNGGIYVTSASQTLITKNYVSTSSYGIGLDDSSENTVSENSVFDNNIGISLTNSSNNTVIGNYLYRNGNYASLLLRFHSNKNVISRNRLEGILLDDSDENTIEYNNIFKKKPFVITRNSEQNIWYQNYWNRPRLLPKLIINIVDEDDRISIQLDFDLYPALRPYEI